MARQIITTPIPDLDTSWENYAGSSVEEFIKRELKSGCGYIYRSRSKEGEFYYLYGFHSIEDYYDWEAGEPITPLFRVQLPNIENDVYSVNLETNSNTTKLVNLGDGVKINLRYTSVATNPITQESHDTYDEGTLIIQRSSNGGVFMEVGRILISPKETGDESWTEVDITRFLADGDNSIRLRVEDNVNGAMSNNIVFKSIVNTSLVITNANDLSKPITQMSLQYYIQGQIAKTLHIKITDSDGDYQSFEFALGLNTYIEVPYTAVIDGEFESGVKTIDAWLTVDDTVLESTHSIIQVYYITEGSDESVIILNNVNTEATNYTNFKFFDFTLYNATSDVSVVVSDGFNTLFSQIIPDCQVETLYSLVNALEIEDDRDLIEAVVSVSTSDMTTSYSLTIDNSVDFSPVAGADFVLNPKNRSNSETGKNTIINDITGIAVPSTFTGFSFKTDGWIQDSDGVKCLRVPAGRNIEIGYDAFTNLTNGTSIELDYKTSNIFGEDEVVFLCGEYDDNEELHGFEMKPLEAAFMTVEKQNRLDQDILFSEQERTHIVVNILPNVSGAGVNYIRIFVNGIINREIIYTSTDIFKTGTPKIVIGSENNDIDIYGMRIYKMGISAADVRQNFMSRIPDVEDKIAFKTANDILSANGTISYDKAVNKFNCIVWKGQNLPSYSTGNVKFTGDLEIKLVDDLAHSGVITNLKCKGQGSSSRGYWKWNQGYSWTENSVWTDGLGETHTNGYNLTDDVPAALELVGKVNWASSQQSHKMGATALYNDLWKAIIGGNGITHTEGYEDCRVAVLEKPFLFFTQLGDSTTPTFYSFMTFGSAKGDVPTFVGSESVFPDYAMIEGADNGSPVILRQVPWIDDELIWDEDEETLSYASIASIDFDLGNKENLYYFKNAFNFTYLHSLNLLPYDGDLEDINEDSDVNKAYQYWNNSNYYVYRYDYISNTWVDAGITRIQDYEYHYETIEGEQVLVVDQYPTYTTLSIATQTGLSPTGTDEEKNTAFKNWRANHFKSNISTYYETSDTLFTMAFCKLIAATDNRAKNTYEYLDPVSKKIRFAQDDLDTIFATDNVGRKNKPYYVEEHTMNGTSYYWNGSTNVFYNLMETAFSTEYRAMMKSILNTMGSTEFGGNSEVCMNNYFFNTQKYFPAVAYNEVARLFYEEAAVAQEAGIYENGTPAISQSLGDQLQCENQWWNRRSIFMKSWGAANPFDVRSQGGLGFRSILTTSSQSPTYQFRLTPYLWLYPKVGVGQSLNSDNTLVQAGNTYLTTTLLADDDTDCFIYGANYYTNFGEFGGHSIGSTFNLSGNKLKEFSADSREVESYQFRPTAMTVVCPVLKKLVVYGCSTLTGSLNLGSELKLEYLDLRGSNLTTITLPQTDTLKDIYIPNLTSLIAVGLGTPDTFSMEGYSNLRNLTTDSASILDTLLGNTNLLTEIHLQGIDYETDSTTKSERLYNLLLAANSTSTGHISINKALTVQEKQALIDKYGDITSPTNSLYIEYTIVPGTTVVVSGANSVSQGKTSTYTFTYDGNDATGFTWSVTDTYETGSEINQNGVLSAGSLLSTDKDVIVKCTVQKLDGTSITGTRTVSIVAPIYIESITPRDLTIKEIDEHVAILYWDYSPSNFTVMPVEGRATIEVAENDYLTLNSISACVHGESFGAAVFRKNRDKTMPNEPVEIPYTITVIDEDDNELTASGNIIIYKPEIISISMHIFGSGSSIYESTTSDWVVIEDGVLKSQKSIMLMRSNSSNTFNTDSEALADGYTIEFSDLNIIEAKGGATGRDNLTSSIHFNIRTEAPNKISLYFPNTAQISYVKASVNLKLSKNGITVGNYYLENDEFWIDNRG